MASTTTMAPPPPSDYLRRHAANPSAINQSVYRSIMTDDAALLRRILDDVGIEYIHRHCMMIEPLVTTRVPVDDDKNYEGGHDNGPDDTNAAPVADTDVTKDTSRCISPRPNDDGKEHRPDDDYSSGDSSGDSSGSGSIGGTNIPTLEVILDDSFHGNEGLEVFLGGDEEKYGQEENAAASRCVETDEDGQTSQQKEDRKSETGKTLFHIAAYYGSQDSIALLADSCNEQFRNLTSSVEHGHSVLVRLLSLPTAEGSTALHLAAYRNHPRTVQVLVQSGADANQASANGSTAAIIAAAQNNVGVLQVLDNAGANLNATDHDGYAPFHAACASGSVEALRYLFECRNISDGHAEAVEDSMSVEDSMDFTQTTKSGFACAALAAKHNRAKVVEYLSTIHQKDKQAPDINQRIMAPDTTDTFNLDSPIHIATKYGCVDALRAFLTSRSCDTDARDIFSRTALTLAVSEGKVDCVRCFAESLSPADFELFDAEDVSGMTPLYLASKLGYADIVSILAPISDVQVMCLVEAEDLVLDNKESKTTDTISEDEEAKRGNDGKEDKGEISKQNPIEEFPMADRTISQTPLLAAVIHNHIECARILLENGADVNQTDDKGHSALSIAARYGYYPLAALLVSSGADLSLRSYRGGGTALQKAKKYKHTKIIELLEKHEMLNDSNLEGVV